ncbi:MAG: alcohol dehydrogenase catalytic domain-containing protein, partial [Bacillota bacterium]
MRCAVLTEIYKFHLDNLPQPKPKPGEVLIKVNLTGICGSEVHAFKGTHPYRKPPVILGHELAGRIVVVTPGVKKLQVGDRVTVEPQISCQNCSFCLRGDINLCNSKIVLGTKEWPGSFAEYITAPESIVYKLPDNLSDAEGVMVEPLAVAVHAVKKSELAFTDTCVILGAGTIGLMTLLCVKIAGATNIIVTDTVDYNLDVAKKMGADYAFNVKKVNTTAAIKKITGEKGSDVVFITAGIPSVLNDSLQCVIKKGRVVPVALFDEAVPVEMFRITGSELNISGTIMYNHDDFEDAIKLLGKKTVDVNPAITH